MAISKHGRFVNPAKSPWNFETFDSRLEELMMQRLENDPQVKYWMKRHGITIPWIDGQKHQRRYVPDFLVEYVDGRMVIIETKDPSRIQDSLDVQRKRKAAEIWCKQRRMEYVLATIG